MIVRLGIKTVHRCQVVALAWSRFNPSIRLLIAVKLMDLIVTPMVQSPRHSNSLKGRPGHSGQQSACFQPDLRSLRHFYRIPSHSVTVVDTVDQHVASALLAQFRRRYGDPPSAFPIGPFFASFFIRAEARQCAA